MEPIKTWYDAANEIESEKSYLDDSLTALWVWRESIEQEACFSEKAEQWALLNFAQRYPPYHSLLRIILEDLELHLKKLSEVEDALYERFREERKECKKGGKPQ